jgi:hypothetical protein
MTLGDNLVLGDFGDARLGKRGVFCSAVWWGGRVSVFAVWRVADAVALLVFRDFLPIRG